MASAGENDRKEKYQICQPAEYSQSEDTPLPIVMGLIGLSYQHGIHTQVALHYAAYGMMFEKNCTTDWSEKLRKLSALGSTSLRDLPKPVRIHQAN